MRRLLLSLACLALCASAASAQGITISASQHVVPPGGTTDVTVDGSPGTIFALAMSTQNLGLSHAGTTLALGTDFAVVQLGALPASGRVVVQVTPPFALRDRIYLQAVSSSTASFSSITASNSLVLVNSQIASVLLPIGGRVFANGLGQSLSPGVTVTRLNTGIYRIDHPGLFALPTPVASFTPIGPAYVALQSSTADQTTVHFTTDTEFYFTIQSVRR